MEENMKWEQVSLIGELMQGKELAKKLCDHLASPSSPSPPSHETNEVLIEKILSTYDKVLTMLNCKSNNGNMMDSHCSSPANGSPRSVVFDLEVKHKDVFKKRKTMPRWTKQVKVCSGTAPDGSLEDGYSWRKYGQKDILGAKFPRGYYRCTHRHAQGCLATKQVQKSDEDPTIYEITYKGRHTCIQAGHSHKAIPSKPKMDLGEENKDHKYQKNQPQEEKVEQPQGTMFTSGTSKHEVKIEDLDPKEDIFPSFCFTSPSIGSENEDNNMFPEAMIENPFMELESFSPTFISPANSETNIFCMSPCQLGSNGLGLSVQTSDSDITEILSAPTSATNSPIVDLDFLLDKVDFDTEFPINSPEFISS